MSKQQIERKERYKIDEQTGEILGNHFVTIPEDEDIIDRLNYLEEQLKKENQQVKLQVRDEIVEKIRERLKKANFEIMSPIVYSYTDNFLYQVKKGESNVKD